eukprot:gene3851-11317_t
MRCAAVLLVAAGAAAGGTCSSGCCTCTQGQNNAGNDLGAPHLEVASADACCTLCKQQGAACTGYVYVQTKRCYLKSTWVGDYADADVVGSGIPLAVCPTSSPPVPAPPVPTPSPDMQPVWLCDNATRSCKSVAPYTAGSTSKELCAQQVASGTCPPLPPAAKVYVCSPQTTACEEVPAGTGGSAGLELCKQACVPPTPTPG